MPIHCSLSALREHRAQPRLLKRSPRSTAVFIGRAIERVTVAMRKLDRILDAALAPLPALVKIDVEAFELEALKGLMDY